MIPDRVEMLMRYIAQWADEDGGSTGELHLRKVWQDGQWIIETQSVHPVSTWHLGPRDPAPPKPKAHPANCEDCGCWGQMIYKGDHHGGTKRVCVDRNACHHRQGR